MNQRKIGEQQGSVLVRWGIYLFLNVLVITMILPILNSFVVSFSSNVASMQTGLKLWPSEWSLEGYQTVWTKMELWLPFVNNSIVTVAGTIIHVFLASMAGYMLIQKGLPGKKFMVTFIMLTMVVPSETIMIPLYIVNKDLGLLNTLSSLVLSGLVSGFSILLMRNFFLSVPDSIAESARIDGAGDFFIFWKLYLPIAKPGLMTVLLFEFVSRWNHFTSALLYINDPDKYTLQIALQALVIGSDSTSTSTFFTPNVRMAGIMIALIPLLVIYPFVQKYFVKGISLGSTKE
ncbi:MULTISPECIES: carbohydrate ABC transporter permease [Bacillus]|uniref:ABC transporter permease n=2 Tax=Bacillus TaxID=1386 RepID=A0A0M4FU79_9BACI|nr:MULTISPECIES: carbohydrate ABC transporter permease [Bacillus]ALC81893.1 ABC transporter permease [Bacillus gobiensis]MBP1083205.1 putative aldouronate transport system permease protein [Bacillus capparidis]MED1097645.1 carbohydrate ABC transporter permease [Bacillus capparidis]